MKLERYLVKTKLNSVERFEVWNSQKPFYFGYPLKWVIEKKENGLRVREINTNIRSISKSFLKDFTDQETQQNIHLGLPSEEPIELQLKMIEEFTPLYAVIQKEIVESKGYDKFMVVRTVDAWVEDTQFFEDQFDGFSKGEKLFQIRFSEAMVKIIWFKNGLHYETHKGAIKQSKKNDVFEMPKDEFIGSKIFLPEVQWYFGLCRSAHLPKKLVQNKSNVEMNDKFLFLLLLVLLLGVTSLFYYFHKTHSFDPYIKKTAEKEIKEYDFSVKTPPPQLVTKMREAVQNRQTVEVAPTPIVENKVPAPVPVVPIEKKVTVAPKVKAQELPPSQPIKTVQKNMQAAPQKNVTQNKISEVKKETSAFDQLLNSLSNKKLTQQIHQTQNKNNSQLKNNEQVNNAPLTTPTLLSNETKTIQQKEQQQKIQSGVPLNTDLQMDKNKLLSENITNQKPLYEKSNPNEKLSIVGQGSTFVDIRPSNAQISQGLSKEEVDPVIRADFQNIRNCYQKSFSNSMQQNGILKVNFIISTMGQVTNARLDQSSFNNSPFEQCVLNRVRSWVFPQPVGGVNVQVNYPIHFQKGSGL